MLLVLEISIDSFAAFLMLRGVVESSETPPRMVVAWLILSLYSFSFFLLTNPTPPKISREDDNSILVSAYAYGGAFSYTIIVWVD